MDSAKLIYRKKLNLQAKLLPAQYDANIFSMESFDYIEEQILNDFEDKFISSSSDEIRIRVKYIGDTPIFKDEDPFEDVLLFRKYNELFYEYIKKYVLHQYVGIVIKSMYLEDGNLVVNLY